MGKRIDNSNDSSFPTDLLWSPKDIAREFNVSQATAFRRLKDAGLSGKGDGKYLTSEVCQAMLGDCTAERTKLVIAQREEQTLRVSQMRGELIHKDDLLQALQTIFTAVRQIILSSDLSKRDKDDILKEMSSFGVQVSHAEKKSRERLGLRRSSHEPETEDGADGASRPEETKGHKKLVSEN